MVQSSIDLLKPAGRLVDKGVTPGTLVKKGKHWGNEGLCGGMLCLSSLPGALKAKVGMLMGNLGLGMLTSSMFPNFNTRTTYVVFSSF